MRSLAEMRNRNAANDIWEYGKRVDEAGTQFKPKQEKQTVCWRNLKWGRHKSIAIVDNDDDFSVYFVAHFRERLVGC